MTAARTILLGLLAAVPPFLFGWYCRGHLAASEVKPVETVRVDTVYYERPTAVASQGRIVAVRVPRVLFAPAPEVAGSAENPNDSGISDDRKNPNDSGFSVGADSITVAMTVETRTYEDSLYRAQVSGPAVGELRPTLDWVQVCDRTVVRTVTRRPRFALTAGVGVAYTPQGLQPTAGVQVGVVLWGK